LFLVGHLLRSTGAFFIRRQWGQDELYHEVMREYIEVLLKKGHNIEAFVEGTRSRIGKLLQPRYGILKIILNALLQGTVDDCIIVPMSIGYDKVLLDLLRKGYRDFGLCNRAFGITKAERDIGAAVSEYQSIEFQVGTYRCAVRIAFFFERTYNSSCER
jgi:1-acyl-sn-glycerol-3-phosphate acyltransferase